MRSLTDLFKEMELNPPTKEEVIIQERLDREEWDREDLAEQMLREDAWETMEKTDECQHFMKKEGIISDW